MNVSKRKTTPRLPSGWKRPRSQCRNSPAGTLIVEVRGWRWLQARLNGRNVWTTCHPPDHPFARALTGGSGRLLCAIDADRSDRALVARPLPVLLLDPRSLAGPVCIFEALRDHALQSVRDDGRPQCGTVVEARTQMR